MANLFKLSNKLELLLMAIWLFILKKTGIKEETIQTKIRAWQDSNLQSPDPKSGALSIRPHTLFFFKLFNLHFGSYNRIKLKQLTLRAPYVIQ